MGLFGNSAAVSRKKAATDCQHLLCICDGQNRTTRPIVHGELMLESTTCVELVELEVGWVGREADRNLGCVGSCGVFSTCGCWVDMVHQMERCRSPLLLLSLSTFLLF